MPVTYLPTLSILPRWLQVYSSYLQYNRTQRLFLLTKPKVEKLVNSQLLVFLFFCFFLFKSRFRHSFYLLTDHTASCQTYLPTNSSPSDLPTEAETVVQPTSVILSRCCLFSSTLCSTLIVLVNHQSGVVMLFMCRTSTKQFRPQMNLSSPWQQPPTGGSSQPVTIEIRH